MRVVEVPWPVSNECLTVTDITNRDALAVYHFRTPAVIPVGAGYFALVDHAPNAPKRSGCLSLIRGDLVTPAAKTRPFTGKVAPTIFFQSANLKPLTDYFFNVRADNAAYARSFQVQVTLEPPTTAIVALVEEDVPQ